VPTFYKMAYIEQPVYADPGSNGWTGNQYWATQRLAELYYIIKTDSSAASAVSSIKPGGLSVEEALKTVLDKWVNFFLKNTELIGDDDYAVPAGLKWEGAPDDWNGTYKENSSLHAVMNGTQHSDVGCVNSYAHTLLYYAAANGVKSDAAYQDSSDLAEKSLYLARELMLRSWALGRDDIGVSITEHNGSLARFWAQKVYTGGSSGKYPYGYEVGDDATFIKIRPMYEDPGQSYSDLYAELKAAYEKDVAKGAKIDEFSGTYSYGMDCRTGNDDFKNVEAVDLNYHRFWHEGDVIMANGAMALLYPDVEVGTTKKTDTTSSQTETTTTKESTDSSKTETKDAVWGDADCNGSVDVSDAVLLAKYLNSDSSAKITDQGQVNANVITGDLDTDDLSAILMYIARMITEDEFPLSKLPTN